MVRGSIGIVHGLGEHSSRYAELAKRLVGCGYSVHTFDQRGHGRTNGKRGDAPSYDVLLDDIEVLLDTMTQHNPSLPRFLFGQSLGGGLALNMALRRNPNLNGIIASSPLLMPTKPPPRWKETTGRFLRTTWPSFRFQTGVKAHDLTHDEAAREAHASDPFIHHVVSARLAVAMLDHGRWAVDHASKLKIPTLLMHGDEDAITSIEATREFARRSPRCSTLQTFSGLYHELHWEREREEVAEVVLEWIGERLCKERQT